MSKIYNIKGIKLACASSNTRYGKRNDSLIITLDEKSTISGKFTSNSFKAAPIKIAKKTDALVVGVNPGGSKISKAEELDVPIINEEAFEQLLEKGEIPN